MTFGITSKFLAMAVSVFLSVSAAGARDYPIDPLNSPMWNYHAERIFGDAPVTFDARVKTIFPEIAENQRSFPVTIDAREIKNVKRMVLFADLNPIPIAVDYRPTEAQNYFSTRIKLDQRTPVRGAVQLESGEWLVSGGWIDAAGGGCSAPPVSRVKGDWAEHLGEIRAMAWQDNDNADMSRIRFNIRHPMDTGLVENISIYNISNVILRDENGKMLAEAFIEASVSEDPSFTFMPQVGKGQKLAIDARDTNGRNYLGKVIVAKPVSSALALNR